MQRSDGYANSQVEILGTPAVVPHDNAQAVVEARAKLRALGLSCTVYLRSDGLWTSHLKEAVFGDVIKARQALKRWETVRSLPSSA